MYQTVINNLQIVNNYIRPYHRPKLNIIFKNTLLTTFHVDQFTRLSVQGPIISADTANIRKIIPPMIVTVLTDILDAIMRPPTTASPVHKK